MNGSISQQFSLSLDSVSHLREGKYQGLECFLRRPLISSFNHSALKEQAWSLAAASYALTSPLSHKERKFRREPIHTHYGYCANFGKLLRSSRLQPQTRARRKRRGPPLPRS